ncbi:unnamed protein product [Porites lobata]|uniref:Uncharacterized protein n=1 Tax=Porites lobata TaxID=104759 RepID=A0ABN8MRU6_9CNID|nr:unnamed protein product [Porites lobata]
MGSYDGAETCELVGSFLLSQLKHLDVNIGLYRDDGLAISNAAPRDKENIKKEICLSPSREQPPTDHHITAGINRRLSSLSSNKASFDQAIPPYQKALDESGYHYTLHYEPTTTAKRRNRQRNSILWYNPPFSKNVNTNIGHRFLTLVDKHFPIKGEQTKKNLQPQYHQDQLQLHE